MKKLLPTGFPIKNKLVMVSNRELYTEKNGVRVRNPGGVATSIDSVLQVTGGHWVVRSEREGAAEYVVQKSPKYTIHSFPLSEKETHYYYHKFSSALLWPLCHSFIERCEFNDKAFNWYIKVNQKFADEACKIISSTSTVWIHDFHLCLLPEYIRARGKDCVILFSWHEPFPPPGIYMVLPQRKELLTGMLHSDIISFHCEIDVKNFINSCKLILKAEVNEKSGTVKYNDRITRIKAIPIGINWKAFEEMGKDKGIIERAEKIRKRLGSNNIILGVERLDYTKGTIQRLHAYELFLDKYPEVREKVTLIQVVSPSRTQVRKYQEIREEIDKMVGKIQGRFSTPEWSPIVYLSQVLSPGTLATYYLLADVALITPLIDGWNLVAEEYVATKEGLPGVLILSEFTGCGEIFKEAFIVNPYNISDVADTLLQAVKTSSVKRMAMMKSLRFHVKKYDMQNWYSSILREVDKLKIKSS